MRLILVVAVAVCISCVSAAPIVAGAIDDEIKGIDFEEDKVYNVVALRYLNEFGYLHTHSPTEDQWKSAVKTFQDMAGIEKNGVLDTDTMDQMSQPRCGNNDVSNRGSSRGKRFLFVSRWENKVRDNTLKLKWFIKTYTKDIPREQIKKTVRKAFSLWSNQVALKPVTSLTLHFDEAATEEEADITILWAEGDHGDMHKFDGPGKDSSNILAHTFYPNSPANKAHLNGDIHFDDYENWNVDNNGEGASFPHVLVHEIGHSLGLGHSKKQQAIMFPIYRKDSMDLDFDDKCAINWNYVGASEICLFIYLLSEVVPRRIAIERDSTYLVDTNAITEEDFALMMTREELVKARIHSTALPLCRDDNRVRHHYETMLQKRLNFPTDILADYGDMMCRFFEGLHTVFKTPVTESFHDTFRMNGVHNYFSKSAQFDDLRKSVGDRKFDAEFFDWIISEFSK